MREGTCGQSTIDSATKRVKAYVIPFAYEEHTATSALKVLSSTSASVKGKATVMGDVFSAIDVFIEEVSMDAVSTTRGNV